MSTIPPDEPTKPSVRDPVVSLASRPRRAPWPELALKFDELAEMARRGEIAGAGYVIEMADGETGYRCFHDVGSNVKKMLGEIDVMKHAILRRHCEPDDE